MSILVHSVHCSCNINQLRAKLQGLDNRWGSRGWISDRGERLVFGEYPYVNMIYGGISGHIGNHKPVGMLDWENENELEGAIKPNVRRPATRSSWVVLKWRSASMRPEYHPIERIYTTAIEAYEESDHQTRVDFLDAYDPSDPKRECPPIGQPFEEFAEMITKELNSVKNQETVVLLLTADPSDATRLRLGEEIREIRERLQLAKLRENFTLHQRMSVRPADVSQALLNLHHVY